MLKFLYIPFPRPKTNRKNLIWILSLGLLATLFVLAFNPFGIVNTKTSGYYVLVLFSIGMVFSTAIILMELLVPAVFRRFFRKWNLGKAILWYTWMIVFVGGVVFLYKSFLAGFSDFTWLEYLNVVGRISGIAFIVSFFAIGLYGYLKGTNMKQLAANEEYLIEAPGVSPLRLNLDQVLYIESDDNYVDIHIEVADRRDKIVFRSSLQNMEAQIVNPLTPMYRCHRSYIININRVTVKNKKKRNTSLELKKYKDEIPVSGTYVDTILKLMQIHP